MKVNVLTTWGKQHMAEIVANGQPLSISHIRVGDGTVSSRDEALALDSLVNYKNTYPITSIDKQDDIVIIASSINNIGLTTGIMIREIGIYVESNGEQKLFWYINNDNDVTYLHSVSNGILKIDSTYQMIYAGDEVNIMNNYELDYFVSRKYMEEYCTSLGKVYVSDTAPETPEPGVIWIDTSNPVSTPVDTEDEFIQIAMKALRKMQNKVLGMEYLLTKKFDAGLRTVASTNQTVVDEDVDDVVDDADYVPNMDNYINMETGKLCIAGGVRDAMGTLFPRELYYDTSEKALYIGDSTGGVSLLATVGGSSSGSNSGNLTGEYLELISPKGEVYKVTVTDAGALDIYLSSIDNVGLPNPVEPTSTGIYHENWDNYKDSKDFGLCINQIYSGGSLNAGDTPVSHSFIEIYNNSERDINLRGLSVQYAKTGVDWKVCELDGILPGNTSYLIRCVLNNNPYKLACRLKINNYDKSWDQELSPTGMKVVLVVGTEPLTTENPYRDPKNGIPSIYRYIDMLGAGGANASEKVDYVEGYFARQCLDKNTSICRAFVKGTKDSNDNLLDTVSVNYKYANLDYYAPRCKADGTWDIYRDKLSLSETRPNMIFIAFGKEASTRIFTWQTKPTETGKLKIYKLTNMVMNNGSYELEEIPGYKRFTTYDSTIKNISHHDTSACTHSVIVKNLTPGTYIYKCGEEGKWSDENEITVYNELYGDFTTEQLPGEDYSNRNIRFLHTSDQQGWDANEYVAWKHAADYIRRVEQLEPIAETGRSNYDWRVNTGDCSQNGNRSYEWRYYYDATKDDLTQMIEMSVAGNNDLVDKNKSEAYTYYTTYEDSPYPSCYEFFIGDVHFLSINTWAAVDVDYEDLDGGVGFTKKQQAWLQEKLRGPRKRWTILLTHVAPYTVVKYKYAQPYGPIIDGNNGEYAPVDVVLCGHNHCYSRSKAMKDGDIIDPLDGVYHVMSQATGYKLKGKSGPNSKGEVWYGENADGSSSVSTPPHPSYIMWEITKDYIQMDSYMITGIIVKDATTGLVTYGDPSTYQKEKFDTFKIYHRSVRPDHIDEL